MNNIKLDSIKSFEIMNDVVSKIKAINNNINLLKDTFAEKNINEAWICPNATIFNSKSIQLIEQINFTCLEMYKNVLTLMESMENYVALDKEVSVNHE